MYFQIIKQSWFYVKNGLPYIFYTPVWTGDHCRSSCSVRVFHPGVKDVRNRCELTNPNVAVVPGEVVLRAVIIPDLLVHPTWKDRTPCVKQQINVYFGLLTNRIDGKRNKHKQLEEMTDEAEYKEGQQAQGDTKEKSTRNKSSCGGGVDREYWWGPACRDSSQVVWLWMSNYPDAAALGS